MEDVFEALVGAIYLDSGLVPAKAFVIQCLCQNFDWSSIGTDDNYKDQLMRYCQTFHELPTYVTSNKRIDGGFTSKAIVNGREFPTGSGKSKKEAEQVAAWNVIKELNIDNNRDASKC